MQGLTRIAVRKNRLDGHPSDRNRITYARSNPANRESASGSCIHPQKNLPEEFLATRKARRRAQGRRKSCEARPREAGWRSRRGLPPTVFACLLDFRSALPTLIPTHQIRFALAEASQAQPSARAIRCDVGGAASPAQVVRRSKSANSFAIERWLQLCADRHRSRRLLIPIVRFENLRSPYGLALDAVCFLRSRTRRFAIELR